MPRKDHVVVVLSRSGRVALWHDACVHWGVPVVAIEIRPDADNIAARRPVPSRSVVGRGSSRAVLQRLSLGRARALAGRDL